MVIWSHVGLAALWGGLLALERRAFLQAMISRPLVAATGMGLLLNDPQSGLAVGMVLELFHLGSANLGAALPENDTVAATGAAAAACGLAGGTGLSTPAMWSLAIVFFVGLGQAGRFLRRGPGGYASRPAPQGPGSAEEGGPGRAGRREPLGGWAGVFVFAAAAAASGV